MGRLIIILLCLFSFSGFSQTKKGNLESYLNTKLNGLPSIGSNDYSVPKSLELVTWENMLNLVLENKILEARKAADSNNYKIVEFTDTNNSENHLYFIIEEKLPKTKYWGVYVMNSNGCRKNLIIQAPHTQFDFNTGKQAVFCFARLNAMALFLNGAHRCNSDSTSFCSGTTSVCTGSSSGFKVSDLAHNSNSAFQKSTEILYSKNSSAVFVQLHGFGKKTNDPYVILSNGTRKTPSTDWVENLKKELEKIDDTLTFKIAHKDLTWNRLIALTNTQGRLVNQSSNPCLISSTSTNGNFVHIEQEKNRLRKDSLGWNKMKVALENVFVCLPTIIYRDAKQKNELLVYPNPTESEIAINGNGIIKIELTDLKGVVVLVRAATMGGNVGLNVRNLERGIYFLKVYFSNEVLSKKIILR